MKLLSLEENKEEQDLNLKKKVSTVNFGLSMSGLSAVLKSKCNWKFINFFFKYKNKILPEIKGCIAFTIFM